MINQTEKNHQGLSKGLYGSNTHIKLDAQIVDSDLDSPGDRVDFSHSIKNNVDSGLGKREKKTEPMKTIFSISATSILLLDEIFQRTDV